MAKPTRAEYYCVKCGRFQLKKDFNLNYNKYLKEYNDGRMLYCNSCAKDISQDIMSDYGVFELGLRAVCTYFNMPIVEEAIVKLKDLYDSRPKEPNWNWVTQYGAMLKELNILDSYWDNLSGNSLAFDETFRQLKENELKVMTELNNLWGDRTLKEYEFLNSRWYKYTDGLRLTTAQASLYRQLCVQELYIRQNEKNKDTIRDIKDIQGEIMKLMNKLGIDKFESNDKSLDEKMLESQIEYIEREEPSDHYEDLEMFKDYRGIGKYFEDNIIRPFRNLLLNSKDYKILDEFLNKKKGKGKNDKAR